MPVAARSWLRASATPGCDGTGEGPAVRFLPPFPHHPEACRVWQCGDVNDTVLPPTDGGFGIEHVGIGLTRLSPGGSSESFDRLRTITALSWCKSR